MENGISALECLRALCKPYNGAGRVCRADKVLGAVFRALCLL
ncbi:hypothetical protein APS_0146 [Acetobacter pasteurianus subsp. pasteurianus LMG 1262 = NBRC 106471]|nr:hypothetical protein APS_0146 [Acetobacter pasteurianus subsp. pasteurianus LMG 1262 = NBRC 106471]